MPLSVYNSGLGICVEIRIRYGLDVCPSSISATFVQVSSDGLGTLLVTHGDAINTFVQFFLVNTQCACPCLQRAFSLYPTHLSEHNYFEYAPPRHTRNARPDQTTQHSTTQHNAVFFFSIQGADYLAYDTNECCWVAVDLATVKETKMALEHARLQLMNLG